jgi:hypothetical protein
MGALSSDRPRRGDDSPATSAARHLQKRYRFYDPANPDARPDGFVYGAVDPCPYEGTSYFTQTGQTTTKPFDRCSRQLDNGCKLRFGNDPLPFGGFPGAARVRL